MYHCPYNKCLWLRVYSLLSIRLLFSLTDESVWEPPIVELVVPPVPDLNWDVPFVLGRDDRWVTSLWSIFTLFLSHFFYQLYTLRLRGSVISQFLTFLLIISSTLRINWQTLSFQPLVLLLVTYVTFFITTGRSSINSISNVL